MMYDTQPSGSTVSSGAATSVTWYSDTFSAGQQLQSGTSTFYIYGQCGFGGDVVTLTLVAGSTTVDARADYAHILALRYKEPGTSLGPEE